MEKMKNWQTQNLKEQLKKEFEKTLNEFFKNINKEDLLKDLIECGLVIQRGDKDD